MKSELKFAFHVVLLLIIVLLFDIITFDNYSYSASWTIGKFIAAHYEHIQVAWSFHIVVIAITTAMLILFQIKKKVNLWELATKIMWLTFLGVIIIHLAGIFTGIDLYLY